MHARRDRMRPGRPRRGLPRHGPGPTGRARVGRLPELPGRRRPQGRRLGRGAGAALAITSLLGAAANGLLRRFNADDGHDADGYASAATWLGRKTRLGGRDAKAAVRQMRLLARHPSWTPPPPRATSPSVAREIAGWTRRIDHEELQTEADRILVEAATAGADLDDLKLIAQAAYEAWRAQEPDPEEDPLGRGFGDRYLDLQTTMDGAGRIRGDLTPECAAAVTAVVEALGKPRGPEDFRSAGQRYHDALQEGCELLIRAKMVPDRAGADTRVDVHIGIRDLLGKDGASVIEDTWLRARLASTATWPARTPRRSRATPSRPGRDRKPRLGRHRPDDQPGRRRLRTRLRRLHRRAPQEPGRAARPPPLSSQEWQDLQYALARLAIHFVSGPGALRVRAAPQPPRRAPERQERHPRHRLLRHHPGAHPPGRHRPRQGLRLARRPRPASGRLRCPPREAQKARREDQRTEIA